MEIRIKTGENLKCYYTGEESKVLVNLCVDEPTPDQNGNVPAVLTTGWIGRKALEDALKLINSVEGVVPVPVVNQVPTWEAKPQDVKSISQNKVAKKPENPEVAREFERSLVELIENPPKARDNEKEGLSELHLRELIGRYVRLFQDPFRGMFPILNNHIGMSQERFQTILEMLNRP